MELTGWGRDETGSNSRTLQEIEQPIGTREECDADGFRLEDYVCTASQNGQSICFVSIITNFSHF